MLAERTQQRAKSRHSVVYGKLWLMRGDHIQALAYADECLTLAEKTNSRRNIAKGRWLRGQVYLARGQLAEAETELLAAGNCSGVEPLRRFVDSFWDQVYPHPSQTTSLTRPFVTFARVAEQSRPRKEGWGLRPCQRGRHVDT